MFLRKWKFKKMFQGINVFLKLFSFVNFVNGIFKELFYLLPSTLQSERILCSESIFHQVVLLMDISKVITFLVLRFLLFYTKYFKVQLTILFLFENL